MTKIELEAALEAAIKSYGSPLYGEWSVWTDEDTVALEWICKIEETPDTEGQRGDEPWTDWGGDEIIEMAGADTFFNSGIDSYQDKFGNNNVTQWVSWSFEIE